MKKFSHCEERSDEAISSLVHGDCFVLPLEGLAMTNTRFFRAALGRRGSRPIQRSGGRLCPPSRLADS